jgi:outer membrane protein assembly factor BamB
MRNIYCIDQQTGVVKWQWKSTGANGHLANGEWGFHDNKIFLRPGSKFIYAIDTETGAEVWAKPRIDIGEQYKNFVNYKGVLYATSYSNTRLLAINPNTGDELWNFGNKIFRSAYNFSIDPDTDYFYMHDGIKLNCYQLVAK